MRLFKRILLIVLMVVVLTVSVVLLWMSQHYVVPIIMYHHVDTINTHGQANWVTPELFEKQMIYIRKNNYNVITFPELAESIHEKRKLPHKTVVITFDDGYVDNYTLAFPVLKKYKVPATIFLISDVINTEGYLSESQINEMWRNQINFGSHTRTHPYLPKISPEDRQKEIRGSKEVLEKLLKIQIDYFCYPVGGFTEDIKRMVREAGYKGACTTNRGAFRDNSDLYELKRIRFGNKDKTDFKIWAKLSGYYNLFRKTRLPKDEYPYD